MIAFLVMRWQGINANIMSLGGIAIAIGAMVDAAVVMIENAHKKIEAWQHAHPEQQARRRGALAGGHRRGGRGRAGAVLLAADHHAVVHPGVHAAGAGRAAVRPAGLHQDLRDGGGRRAVGDADPGADGLLDPRAHPRRAAQPDHSRADRRLSAGAGLGAASGRRRRCVHRAAGAGHHRLAADAPGRRVPADARRGRPAVHAVGAAGAVGAEGGRAAAADRPHDQDRARGRARVRQGRPRRDRHRPGAAGDVRDHDPAQTPRAVACRHDAGQADRGTRSRGAGAGPVQHLGAADPQPHRHAGHRHQEPDRRQGQRRRPGGDRPRRAAASSRWPRACRACPRRWPSG